MVDKFTDPLLTPAEAARHLRIHPRTLHRWLREQAEGRPLVHWIQPEKRGIPSIPFIAVVEAYMLRFMVNLGLNKNTVRDALSALRREFATPYALVTKRIATDGMEILARYAEKNLTKVRDGQQPNRELADNYLKFIRWDNEDGFPIQLRLRQYPDIAPVVIDPRFGWGTPVIETTKVPVAAVVDLWLAGESLDDVAYEYDMTREQVEAVCQASCARP